MGEQARPCVYQWSSDCVASSLLEGASDRLNLMDTSLIRYWPAFGTLKRGEGKRVALCLCGLPSPCCFFYARNLLVKSIVQ